MKTPPISTMLLLLLALVALIQVQPADSTTLNWNAGNYPSYLERLENGAVTRVRVYVQSGGGLGGPCNATYGISGGGGGGGAYLKLTLEFPDMSMLMLYNIIIQSNGDLFPGKGAGVYFTTGLTIAGPYSIYGNRKYAIFGGNSGISPQGGAGGDIWWTPHNDLTDNNWSALIPQQHPSTTAFADGLCRDFNPAQNATNDFRYYVGGSGASAGYSAHYGFNAGYVTGIHGQGGQANKGGGGGGSICARDTTYGYNFPAGFITQSGQGRYSGSTSTSIDGGNSGGGGGCMVGTGGGPEGTGAPATVMVVIT